MSSTPGKPPAAGKVFARPTPKVSRLKTGKVFNANELATFLAGRPDLKKKPGA